MKKAWSTLFGSGKSFNEFNEYRGYDQRDARADAYFLSHTGVPLKTVVGIRQSEPRTGEFGLGD